ncbi:uncharacterized protein Osi9 [Euwallacea similis]|uniref:uncharacterized protein Osi9 n=1 Tax=Euwallacea similis TaxID=1736056 RepID=UPI003450FD56
MGRNILLLALAVLANLTSALAGDAGEANKEEMEIYKIALDFLDECGAKELSLCLKERALRYIDSLPNELDIGETVKVKPNGRFSRKTEIGQLPDEPRARESIVESFLWDRIADYLSSHTIEIKLPPETVEQMKKADEGRGKNGGIGGGDKGGGQKMKGLMMLIQLKLALLGAIALKFVALVAFKALLVAKVALAMASILSLKKLLEQKHHTSTYEIVASHPHHDDWGHYDRSFTKDQLAYRGYEGASGSTN